MGILAFQKPDKVIMHKDTEFFGQFEFRPLEKGYGVTIGNSLRRILLSSLEGYAITSVKFTGVEHEFSTIKGVIEDVTEIIMNLKQVRFKRIVDGIDNEKIYINIKGQEQFLAGEIGKHTNSFRVLNPDLVICNMEPFVHLEVELTVDKGRGYVTLDTQVKEPTQEVDENYLHVRKILKTPLSDLDLSVRAYNCLKAADIKSLADLVSYDIADLLKFRNFGKKSLSELEELVRDKGLTFGIDISKYKLDQE